MHLLGKTTRNTQLFLVFSKFFKNLSVKVLIGCCPWGINSLWTSPSYQKSKSAFHPSSNLRASLGFLQEDLNFESLIGITFPIYFFYGTWAMRFSLFLGIVRTLRLLVLFLNLYLLLLVVIQRRDDLNRDNNYKNDFGDPASEWPVTLWFWHSVLLLLSFRCMLEPNPTTVSGTRSTPTSRSTRKESTTSWKSTGTRAMRAILSTIHGTVATTAHSPRTTETTTALA